MSYNREDLTEQDVCQHCGIDLRRVDEIHVVDGYHYCSEACAIGHQTGIIIASAKETAQEWYRDCAEVVTPSDIGIVKETIYPSYSHETDMTTIFKDLHSGEKLISTEVIGFYYGIPNDENTNNFIGSLKAIYE